MQYSNWYTKYRGLYQYFNDLSISSALETVVSIVIEHESFYYYLSNVSLIAFKGISILPIQWAKGQRKRESRRRNLSIFQVRSKQCVSYPSKLYLCMMCANYMFLYNCNLRLKDRRRLITITL